MGHQPIATMKYAIAGLFAAVVLPAWAQTELSECASQLASAGLAETGCSEGDYACACNDQYYLDALTSNIEQQCSPEDHAQVTAYTQELCAGGDGADEEDDGDDGEYEEEDGDAAMSTQYAATSSQYAAQPTGGAEYEDGDDDYAMSMSSQYAAQPTAGAGYEEDDGVDYDDDEYYTATSTMAAQPPYPAGNATTGYGYVGPTGTGSVTGGPVEYTGGASVVKGSAWGGVLAAAGGLAFAAL